MPTKISTSAVLRPRGCNIRDATVCPMDRRQPRRRRRAALSCLECRRRKIKCDKNTPCRHCAETQAVCSYRLYRDEATHSSTSPNSLAPSTDQGQSRQLGPTREQAVSCSPSPSAAVQVPAGSRDDTSTELRVGATALQDILHRIDKLEQRPSLDPADALSATGKHVLARQAGLPEPQIVLKKTRVWRWSDWMSLAPEFKPAISCFVAAMSSTPQDDELGALHARMGALLRECKAIARDIKAGRPSRRLAFEELNLMPPSREVADTMVALYFRFFESTHRILHRPTFESEYAGFWSGPQNAPNGVRLKILLAIGMGSSLHEDGLVDSELRSLVHGWVYAAQTWLSGPLEKDRLDMTGLQVYCLTLLTRQIFSIGGDLVWVSTGSLLHTAMQIGMHRDPKHLPPMSVLQAEMRRRLWATILEIATQASLDSAMPPRISLDDFDTEPPSNNNDDEMDESTTTLEPHPKDTYTATSLQLQLLDSLSTRLEILRLLNCMHSQISYRDVLNLGAKLSAAHRSCMSSMRSNETCGVRLFHRNLVDLLLRRFFIPMHCPFAIEAAENPLFHFSRKVILDTALAISSPEYDESFSRLMCIGGGMFREAMRYAISILSFELISQAADQCLDGVSHRNFHQMELLKASVRDMKSLSAERIRAGETNIKGHMFLSMITAQVEAMEANTPCESAIARSAIASIEQYLVILRERASRISWRPPDVASLPSASLASPDALGLDLDFFLPDIDFA